MTCFFGFFFGSTRAGLGDDNGLDRCVDQLQISSGAPCAACSTNGVDIPTQSPVVGISRRNIRQAQAESVLWRHAAGCDVHRVIREQRVGAISHTHETVKPAGIADAFAFTTKIRMEPAFVLGILGKDRCRNQRQKNYCDPPHGLPPAISFAAWRQCPFWISRWAAFALCFASVPRLRRRRRQSR